MRAKELPQMLFYKLARATKSEVYKIATKDQVWDFIFFPDMHAVIGWRSYTMYEGIFSILNVWYFNFNNNLEPADVAINVLKTNSTFQIVAGPFANGTWSEGLGHFLIENVQIRCYYDAILDNPFLVVINNVTAMAIKLMQRRDLKKLSYWEKFKHPEGSFNKPP